MKQEPELVGPEAMVAEAIGAAGDFEILDPAFGFTTIDVPVVERLGRIGPACDDKAGIGPLANASALMTTRRGWSQLSAW